MTTHRRKVDPQPGRTAAQVFAVNERVNQILLEHLAPEAWRARPLGKVRTIAAIFTHMHNVRCKWVRLNAPHLKVPAQLNRVSCTPRQGAVGLAESAARCSEMLAEALNGGGRVETFLRDGWAQPWPVGVEMLCYMLAHEAHHRGQVGLLAHQLGFPLPKEVGYGMWNWEKLGKERGGKKTIKAKQGQKQVLPLPTPTSQKRARQGPRLRGRMTTKKHNPEQNDGD